MNITREQKDALNAVITVELSPSDYNENVEKSIKQYAKKVQMPGFRPGMVPVGMVKKMYGRSILVDEVNRMLNDGVNNYIREQDLSILGNALPAEGQDDSVNWDRPETMVFRFDIGLAPEVKVSVEGESFEKKALSISDEMVEEQIKNIASRYGTVEDAAQVIETDLVYADFIELDENGEIKAGGIFHNAPLNLGRIASSTLRNNLLGKSLGDVVTAFPSDLSENMSDLAAMLGVGKDVAETLTSSFQIKITSVRRLVPAPLEPALFERVYGLEVSSLEQFREKVKGELAQMNSGDSNRILQKAIQERLIDKAALELPDAFLKRWIMFANEKPVTMEQIEAEFDSYARQLRWQLIENQLIQAHNLTVTSQEADEYVSGIIRSQFEKFNGYEMEEEDRKKTVARVMANEEEAKRVYQLLYDQKLMDLFQNLCTITEVEVSQEEFYKP